jgi:hypothetical protein
MERNSTNENFEHFLRQNAEDFRMHPSSKVWDGISENLAKRKRRFYFGLLTLLISSSILGYTVLDFSFLKLSKTTHSIPAPSQITGLKPSDKISTSAKKNSQVSVSGDRSDVTTKTSEIKTIVFAPLTAQPTSNAFANALVTQRESWMADLLNGSSIISSSNFPDGSISNKSSFDFSSVPASPQEDKNIIANKPRAKSAKFSMMFYFTPTVSYRKLSENKSYLRSASPIGVPYSYAALYDVNSAVTHKPSIGLEMGLTSKYAITKNIKLRGGLQFNLNRYDIKAFKYIPEVATIALNNGSSGVQSIGAISNYRNFNGGQTDWLQNFYFQVSTPIGAEIKLHGNEKMYLGVATTVQPTYVLGDRAYLITTDYKNYAEVPWLMRRWNVNTNLETFVAYSTGKLKWQVGPQVRYQLLSSFVNKYPVKENLFDFGLKVGISVNPNQ